VRDDIKAMIADLGAWLRVAAWPTWLAYGVDRARGGFFEALDLETKTCAAEFRRLRVVARQIYVFSEAHRAGLAGAAEAVHLGLRFLERHAVHPQGGYAWRFDLDHRAIDFSRDLYDHAFVLLALASATSVVGVERLRPEALHLLAWIERDFLHPDGGYLESLPHALPRRQNPHMHLLEATLAAYEAFGDVRFIECAHRLLDVFASRLFDGQSGALPEYFDEALRPVRKGGVFLVEPGHHCEWVWLLHRYQVLTARRGDIAEISRRLMAFVDRFGIDPVHGGLVDVVDSGGELVEGAARLWPQTERLKAEFLREDAEPARQMQAIAGMGAFLRKDGLWHERRDAEGVFAEQPAPASSLYHVTGAIRTVEQLV
jgi:mannose-6-phosphate isomerase